MCITGQHRRLNVIVSTRAGERVWRLKRLQPFRQVGAAPFTQRRPVERRSSNIAADLGAVRRVERVGYRSATSTTRWRRRATSFGAVTRRLVNDGRPIAAQSATTSLGRNVTLRIRTATGSTSSWSSTATAASPDWMARTPVLTIEWLAPICPRATAEMNAGSSPFIERTFQRPLQAPGPVA